MTSLLEKKSTLWTLIGAALVVLIVVIGSALASHSTKTPAPPPSPASPEPAAQPAPASPPVQTAPAAPQPQAAAPAPGVDASLKAASDAFASYTAQGGDLSASALDPQSADLDAAAQKLSP